MTPSITQEQAMTALRALLLLVVPSGTEVVQGQVNRVPMPQGKNWCAITPTRRVAMATNERAAIPSTDPAPAAGRTDIGLSTRLDVQVDVYGPASAETTQTMVTVFRDTWAADQLAASGLAPLYCTEPAQMPLVAGEQQYLERWTFEAAMHGNIVTPVSTQFADTIITGLSEVTHAE